MKNLVPWKRADQEQFDESGQSLVLIAIMFAVLLLFVGLAVDVGFGFARSSMFSRAVDSAAMAGVVDLVPSSTDTLAADVRAAQFLGANGWPTSTLTSFVSDRSLTVDGIPQYTITATWPVETYFLRLVGINGFPITHGATAAYFTNSELLTPTAFDSGRMRKAGLFISGSEGCSKVGDPVIPLYADLGIPNEDRPAFNERHSFRISIPDSYATFVGNTNIRVELFDPDSYNVQTGNSAPVTFSNSYAAQSGSSGATLPCITDGWGDQCIIETGEDLEGAFQNPLWYWRVDESWDSSCNLDAGNLQGNAVTIYELYYVDADGDRQTVGKYTADNSDHLASDLKWVSPGSPSGLVSADEGSFQFDFSVIPPNPDGSYSLFLDVTSPRDGGGSAVNVWDLWAGPTSDFYTDLGAAPLQADANLRNLQLANDPYGYSTVGVRVYALGRIPLSHYIEADITTLPLVPLDIDLANQTVYATAFDYDPWNNAAGVQLIPPPQINLKVSTVPASFSDTYIDIVNIGAVDNQCDPDETLQMLSTSCDSGQNCDNTWFNPQLQVCIPDTRYFGGGIIELTVDPHRDMQVWQFAISAGEPFLTR